MEAPSRPIVIDAGSGSIKGGFGGDDAPRVVFPSLVGKPKYIGMACMDTRESCVVTNWDDMEKLIYTTYNELICPPGQHALLMTEAPWNPKANREKLTELVFESFGVPKFYLGVQSVLSLNATGRTTGVVIESGEELTHVVPIYESYALQHMIQRVDLGGQHVTDFMVKLLTERGYMFASTAEREIAQEIKERLCFVANDFELEMMAATASIAVERSFDLQDGQKVVIGNERFRGPEAMFQPSFIGRECAGIHELVYNSIMKSDSDIRRDLWQNLILSGGNTLFPGFAERLLKELKAFAPHASIKVTAPPARQILAWIGGSMWTQAACFENCWISQQEYDETGSAIVHKKCLV